MSRSVRVVAAGCAFGLVLVVLGGFRPGPVAANWALQPTDGGDEGGYSNGPCNFSLSRMCFADSSLHNWGHGLGPTMSGAVSWTMSNSYNTTNLTIAGIGPAGHTNDVDVWYMWDGPSGGSGAEELPWETFARASCQSTSVMNGVTLPHNCNHWHVVINDERMDGRTTEWYRALACHETGHTLGLKHRDWYVDPPDEPGNPAPYRCLGVPGDQWLGPHNADHINSYY